MMGRGRPEVALCRGPILWDCEFRKKVFKKGLHISAFLEIRYTKQRALSLWLLSLQVCDLCPHVLYLHVLYWHCRDAILNGSEALVQFRYRHLETVRMEVEAGERSEFFKSIASKHRLTAVISCSIQSVASVEWESADGVVEQGGIAWVAMGLGSAIASENSSCRECLPDDFLLGIATRRKGGQGRSSEYLHNDGAMLWLCRGRSCLPLVENPVCRPLTLHRKVSLPTTYNREQQG
ncbi:hypothetical protein NDU88_003736 [Pleurodeles waltl]|uniref:Uncharacterized protein n=1 Tax=Pleurodeles waltl TaxID=8319 RepID=A0AAV7VGT5_PLEWA|nr:hypothetical protein NDU88_003736 [Pleurodeles waltl]